MRPWARWTARMTLVAVVFAVAGGGLSDIAFAGTGGDGTGSTALLGGNGPLAALSGVPAGVCGATSALLGSALAGCRGGTAAASERPDIADSGSVRGGTASAPAGAGAAAGVGAADSGGTKIGDQRASSASTGFQGAATSGPGSSPLRQTFGDTLNAPALGASTTNNPASSQSAGLGTLPGLADLRSMTELTDNSAGRGAPGGSTLMPGSALRAADVTGMSSVSFAALAIGALLAGATALKIASRRARDRKAGIGAAI